MKNKRKVKTIISITLSFLVVILGFSYAAFRYTDGGSSSKLVLGDIYMHFKESETLTIENAMPGADYSKYFQFTITGKNTYTEKDIWYDFSLVRGDIPDGKTEDNRIPDKYLKFKLVSVVGEEETVLLEDKTYNDLISRRVYVETINKKTNDEVNRTYRLYMTIDESLLIGNIDTAVFTAEEWANAFASVKVNVSGDFVEKELPVIASEEILKSVDSSTCSSSIVEDGITYLSGTNNCVNFNYVWYSGKLWRITAIYPDGTMKMITEDVITSIGYGSNYNFYIDKSTSSWIYQWLNEDFLDTLYNYENIIVTDSSWNVTSGDAETKLEETTMVSAKVGLLNSYEYYKSYENASDVSGYLNIFYYWWLSNPDNSASSLEVWFVNGYGRIYSNEPGSYTYGVRPSINLQSTIQLAGGTGIKTDPYRIKGDKEDVVPNTTLLSSRTSGEYVNFDGETYRIVEIENGITKINKVDYVIDESDTVITKYFASTTTYGLDTNEQSEDYWDYYLNNTWYSNITSTYKSMLEQGTYYLGTVGSSAQNYKLAICASASNTITTKDCTKTSTTYSGYVGLPRYGEMFSSPLGSGFLSSTNMWLITPCSTSNVWHVDNGGIGGDHKSLSSDALGVRPSINLKSTIKITDGDGTERFPFEISLS